MSTGIKITSAKYGVGVNTVDVTKAIASNIKDGNLNLVITPDSLNVVDPAKGKTKTLNVSYTINNGSVNTQTLKDNEVLIISAPPKREATGLEITKATYGYPGNYVDVTQAVKTLVNNGSINLKVGFKNLGIPDPNPNKQKELKVEYTINGGQNISTFKDGETFNISAPSDQAPSNEDTSNTTGSIMTLLYNNVFRFLLVFLHTISMFTMANYIDPTGSSKISYIAGFIIPLGSYWLLPLYLFIRRLLWTSEIQL